VGWTAEYQGVPRAAEGNMFKRDWFEIVDQTPDKGERVRYWDFAATKGAGAYTAGVLLNKVGKGEYYIEDVMRGQWSSRDRQRIMKQTAQLDEDIYGNVSIWFEKEGGSSGVDAATAIIQAMDGFIIHSEHVTGSKEVRAQPFAAQCEAGNIKLKRGKWNFNYITEMTEFPNGTFKDQVDASSGAYTKLAKKRWKKRKFVHV
jgi:predicted phage terminase large subunit-like protein